jgi:ribosomal-protein-alanine N-acetyltransferase
VLVSAHHFTIAALMELLPIDIDNRNNLKFTASAECREILDVYPAFYKKSGYDKPWIGYFATLDGKEMVGCGGFKGKPTNGKVEIAYGTFTNHQRQGIATQICKLLILLSRQADPLVKITARTLTDNEASKSVLKKNGFHCNGIVFDEEDGNVLEWELS